MLGSAAVAHGLGRGFEIGIAEADVDIMEGLVSVITVAAMLTPLVLSIDLL